MNNLIPSIEQIREALQPLTLKQLEELERLSGVPATTIYKIKRGETANPGVETIGRFLPHVSSVLASSTPSEVANLRQQAPAEEVAHG